jgi:predicted nucleic acid-binding protein
MLVVDASAVVDLLLVRPVAANVERHMETHGYDLHAPHLIDPEVLSALRRTVAAGDATPERATASVADLLELPIERYPHEGLVPRIWGLRENFSAYDATYVALARALTDDGVPLLTTDARLARTMQEHGDTQVILA